VTRAILARKALRVNADPLAHRVNAVIKVFKAHKVLLAPRETKVLPVRADLKENEANRVKSVRRVLKANVARKDPKVYREFVAPRVNVDLRAFRAHAANAAIRASKAQRVTRVFRVPRASEVPLVKTDAMDAMDTHQ
jgi:hypothetical protein